MARIRRMDHGPQPEPHGCRQRPQANTGSYPMSLVKRGKRYRISAFLGTGELGNDDDKTARVATRGNDTAAFVRGSSNDASTRTRSKDLTGTSTRKCDELEAKLTELKSSAARIFSQGTEQVEEKVSM